MAFRLPETLVAGQLYQGDVTAFESSLPQHSRMLVGLVFAERYDGFEVLKAVSPGFMPPEEGK